MKDIKILISSFFIIVSFFLGYYYSTEKDESKYLLENELQYVNITVNKSKIKIDNQNKNIIILINGQESIEKTINF